MAWIELHDDLFDHYKTEQLADKLGLPKVYATGHIISLWLFTLRVAWRYADLSKWGNKGVAQAAQWAGEPDKFVKACQESGFLDGLVVHGWLERAGDLVLDRIRNENRRKERVSRDNPGKIAGNLRATLPYPTLPYPTKQPCGADEGFEAFWNIYPKKTAKAVALKSWLKLNPSPDLKARIQAAVAAHALSDQWTKDGGQYIPHPATWLNQGRWADELPARGSSNGRQVGAAAPIPGKYAHLGEKNG